MSDQDISKFMDLPMLDEQKQCIAAFRDATSNHALASVTCVICAREVIRTDAKEYAVLDIPGIWYLL